MLLAMGNTEQYRHYLSILENARLLCGQF